jgi:hypothetical protein
LQFLHIGWTLYANPHGDINIFSSNCIFLGNKIATIWFGTLFQNWCTSYKTISYPLSKLETFNSKSIQNDPLRKKKGVFSYNYCNKKKMRNYKKKEYLIYFNWITCNIYQKMKP